MDNSHFIGSVNDGIARATLNRPSKYNAWSAEMQEGLLTFLLDCEANSEVRCLVLSGAGRHFMAGGDVKSFVPRLEAAPEDRARDFSDTVRKLNPVIEALHRCQFPIIAKVRGACAGLGLSFMLNCDLAIASDDAHFTFAYTKIGATPDGGASYLLPKLVGLRRAMQIALLSDRVPAKEAERLGLINLVVPENELDDASDDLARRLSEGAIDAMSRTKDLLRNSEGIGLTEALEREADAFGACARGSNLREGVEAFLEKRRPRFTTR